MSKPFSIQAPEEIAKEYAGNKQKIAQAAQMGIVDPTAAVLAGMFIDRMRSAQVMEAAQQPTVAQQVLGGGGVPQPPGNASPMAPATLSSPPPPMMGAPAPQAPMGMADGGLASLPVPDMMFDEPDNGGYSGGGLVAFADGGEASPSSWGTYIEEMVRKLDPDIEIAGRARTPARNAQVGGVSNSYHLIDAARDIRTPAGMDKSQFIAQLKSIFGPDYDVIPSKGASVHVEPGPALGKKVRAGAPPSKAPAVLPERNVNTAEGRAMSVDDWFTTLQSRFGPSEEDKELRAKRMERAKEMASDEYYEKQRKDSMWQTLANIGFNMASSKSPYLLQAVSEAAAAAMPGAQADKKERKALKDRALDMMVQMGAEDRKEALQLFGIAAELHEKGMAQERFEQELQFKETQGELDRAAQILAQRIAAEGKMSDLETVASNIYQGLKKSNSMGLLTKNGKPVKYEDEALRVMADRVAIERLGKNKGGAGADVAADINTRIGVGGGGPQNPAVNYQ